MILTQIKMYFIIAAIVGALAAVGGIYMKGRLDASHAAEVDELKRSIALIAEQKERAERAAKEDAKRLADLEADLANYEILLKEIENETKNAGSECLDASDVERLRKLFEGKSQR